MKREQRTPIVLTVLNISEALSQQVRGNLDWLAEWDTWDYLREDEGALIGYGTTSWPEPEQYLDVIARHVWRVTEEYRPILLSVRPGTPEVKVYGANEEAYREYLDVNEEMAREAEAGPDTAG